MQNLMTAEVEAVMQSIRTLKPLEFPHSEIAELSTDCVIRLEENHENYVVRARIPNARKEDIRVSVDGNRVILGASRKVIRTLKTTSPRIHIGGQGVVDSEDFCIIHCFLFDSTIEVSRARATYKDGELELILPKNSSGGKRLLIN